MAIHDFVGAMRVAHGNENSVAQRVELHPPAGQDAGLV
ncbi:hypothetical protein SAMN04515694_12832 [Leifsonia sp. CL154]|nr:hypothetical protein SAMN04515694_12832 [Leifsonia sp. CL154]